MKTGGVSHADDRTDSGVFTKEQRSADPGGMYAFTGVAMLRHLKQGRKLEKKLDVINENMAFHFEQMMDSKAQFEAEKAKERKLEREALAKAEKQKMEKEQEAIFDAVLQEIFP